MPPINYSAPQLAARERTPTRVRDELVNCLVVAFSTTPRTPNAAPNPIQLRNDVERFLSRAFESAGSSFEQPTAEGLRAAIDHWRRMAGSIVPDASVVQHHYNEMNKLVSQLS